MEQIPPDDQIPQRGEPYRYSEWTDEQLAWEMAHKSDPLRLAQIAFEMLWREERFKVEHGEVES